MMRTAIVTGANRGLGLATARALKVRGYDVCAGAREPTTAAPDVPCWPLDVTDELSVAAFAQRFASEVGKWNVLVNNAGVALDGFDAEVARQTLDVNLKGPIRVFEALWPCSGSDPVVVQVSSGMGTLDALGPRVRERLSASELATEDILELADAFVAAVAKGTHSQLGWPSSAYRVSKAALNAWTRSLAARLGGAARVNAVCPGWVRTDMGGPGASRGVEQGAASIVWAALLGPDGPTGGFFRDGQPIDW